MHLEQEKLLLCAAFYLLGINGGHWICALLSFITKTTRRFTCYLFKYWLCINFSSLLKTNYIKCISSSEFSFLLFVFCFIYQFLFIHSVFSMSSLWLYPRQQRATGWPQWPLPSSILSVAQLTGSTKGLQWKLCPFWHYQNPWSFCFVWMDF